MPIPRQKRFAILRSLGDVLDEVERRHRREAPRGGATPVGGGEWMDTFFKIEALQSLIRCLREGKTPSKSLVIAKEASRKAVRVWNSRREWQVHRWEETAFIWIERTYAKIKEPRIYVQG
jgi:hypothetical protein